MTDLDVDRLRADTPGCAQTTHLNNCGSALPPLVVTETVIDFLRLEERIGGYEALAASTDRIQAARASIAGLVGVRSDQVAFQESATAAWDRALTAIHHTRPLGEGDRVLVASAEYASNVLPLLQLAEATGVAVKFIPDDDSGCVDVDALSDLLDDDVAVVAITHCPSQNGLINDVAAIGGMLAPTDAWYLVDACQSVGQLPVDAGAIGADFLSVTGRKFLRGPRGTGFLAMSDRAIAELEPFPLDLVSGTWTSDGYEILPDARRYEYFERSWAGVVGLAAAVDYAVDCGIQELSARIRTLADYARTRLDAIPGVTVRDRGVVRSGIVTFTIDGVEPMELVLAGRAQHVNLSASGPPTSRYDFDRAGITAVVRLSPHAYNTVEEIDLALEIVAASMS